MAARDVCWAAALAVIGASACAATTRSPAPDLAGWESPVTAAATARAPLPARSPCRLLQTTQRPGTQAPASRTQLVGGVVDRQGPVGDVAVEAVDARGYVRRGRTDRYGAFVFDVPRGPYVLVTHGAHGDRRQLVIAVAGFVQWVLVRLP